MYDKVKSEIQKVMAEIITIEKYLGSVCVAICCCINIFCLFNKLNAFTFGGIVSTTAGKTIFSVIWIAGFLLYIFCILLLWIGENGEKYHGIRFLVMTIMTVEIFWNHWLGWKEIPISALLAVLIALLCFDRIVGRDSGKSAGSTKVKNILQYRDDRKYVPVLINGINSLELRERTANEVGTFVYSAYKYKRRFYSFTFLSVSLPALVVALNSIEIIQGVAINVVISLLSMATVIVTGVMSTMKARESWIRNREYAERAKKEIFACLMGIGKYEQGVEVREKLLAQKLEELYMEEQGQWKKTRSSEDSSQERGAK